jgi:hypothetical protein
MTSVIRRSPLGLFAAAGCLLLSSPATAQCTTVVKQNETITGTTQACGVQFYDELVVSGVIEIDPFEQGVSGSGWLHIKANRIEITDSGMIVATGQGYRGSADAMQQGTELRGPGAGGTPESIFSMMTPGPGGGGAHIGRGGQGTDGSGSCLPAADGGLSYGGAMSLTDNSLLMGSAGGASRSDVNMHVGRGGHGGGAVILEAQAIVLAGSIAADGEASENTLGAGPGGGGGGAIVILTDDFTLETTANLSARGGEAKAAPSLFGGGGGGGLIVLSATGDFEAQLIAQSQVDGGQSAASCCTISMMPFSCGAVGLADQIAMSPGCIDADGDGFASEACGGPDCHDGNDQVNSDVVEGCDGLDNDCDGQIDEEAAEDETPLCAAGLACIEVCADGQTDNCPKSCEPGAPTTTSAGSGLAQGQHVRFGGGLCAMRQGGTGGRLSGWLLVAALAALLGRRRGRQRARRS